jgi:hypothetical protein
MSHQALSNTTSPLPRSCRASLRIVSTSGSGGQMSHSIRCLAPSTRLSPTDFRQRRQDEPPGPFIQHFASFMQLSPTVGSAASEKAYITAVVPNPFPTRSGCTTVAVSSLNSHSMLPLQLRSSHVDFKQRPAPAAVKLTPPTLHSCTRELQGESAMRELTLTFLDIVAEHLLYEFVKDSTTVLSSHGKSAK